VPELRWILLGLGVLFCLGLWLWESRRGRQAADSTAGLNPVEGLASASSSRDNGVRRPTSEAPIFERELAEREPWEDPLEPDAAVPVEDESRDVPSARELPASSIDDDDFILTDTLPVRSLREEGSDHMIDIAAERPAMHRQRIEPVMGDVAGAVSGSAQPQSSQTHAQSQPQSAPRSRLPDIDDVPPPPAPRAVAEKIIAVRVSAPPLERFEGRSLITALRTAGLEHGKFSIFHKLTADGLTLFSVASLVEPGTFELDAVDGRRFPGVSFFAVLQDPAIATTTIEDMLGTARGLASALHGTLQDERGAPLSPQRLTDLRADVAAWVRRAQGEDTD